MSQHVLTNWAHKKASEMTWQIGCAVVLACAITGAVGWAGWPKPTERTFSISERKTFENLIRKARGTTQITAVANDNEAYRFADELVLAFTEAGLGC
jgi:hypothetical protein